MWKNVDKFKVGCRTLGFARVIYSSGSMIKSTHTHTQTQTDREIERERERETEPLSFSLCGLLVYVT